MADGGLADRGATRQVGSLLQSAIRHRAYRTCTRSFVTKPGDPDTAQTPIVLLPQTLDKMLCHHLSPLDEQDAIAQMRAGVLSQLSKPTPNRRSWPRPKQQGTKSPCGWSRMAPAVSLAHGTRGPGARAERQVLVCFPC